MIHRPETAEEAAARVREGPHAPPEARPPEFLAGGTDVMERRALDPDRDLVDLSGLPGLDRIESTGNATHPLRIGALVPLDVIAVDPRIRKGWRGLALPAGILATPQIRRVATLGGVLCQRTRCTWFRHPGFECVKSGGSGCPARDAGTTDTGVLFETGICVYPHPSSVALGLLVHEATFETTAHGRRPVVELWGEGTDPSRDHLLAPDEILTAVHLGPAAPDDAVAHVRLMGRAEAEWPRTECVVRLTLEEGRISGARVAIGAVATVPMRAPAVESALLGASADDPALLARASEAVRTEGTVYAPNLHKAELLVRTVLTTLERALGLEAAPPARDRDRA